MPNFERFFKGRLLFWGRESKECPTGEYFSTDYSRIDYFILYYFITSKGILEKIADKAVSGYEKCAQIGLSRFDITILSDRDHFRLCREKHERFVRFVVFLSFSFDSSPSSYDSLITEA